jgi:hypothetical protein
VLSHVRVGKLLWGLFLFGGLFPQLIIHQCILEGFLGRSRMLIKRPRFTPVYSIVWIINTDTIGNTRISDQMEHIK